MEHALGQERARNCFMRRGEALVPQSLFSRAKCSKQLRVAFKVALVILYSSSSFEWLLAGRVAGPQTPFRCQYLRRGVETIPLEIAKELNLSITLFLGESSLSSLSFLYPPFSLLAVVQMDGISR